MKRKVVPIVGVGASAGGLEALTEFVSNIPQNINMAFVIVQHLEPKHASLMADILSRHTKLCVAQVKNKTGVEANHIYVIPPNANLSISESKLYVTKRDKKFSLKHQPINHFLVSLAGSAKRNSIGIILSGTGTDGSEGIKAVKAAGGLTFAQDEATAKYFSMPYASIRTGLVDFVLSPKDMARKLANNYPSKRPGKEPAASSEESLSSPLENIFSLLKTSLGVDFTHYRRTTILRRIDRRISFNKLKGFGDYYRFLKSNPSELNALYENLLISVTTFFRDPPSFEVLKRKILPALLKAKPAGEPVRIWVPGCSAGQEVYSIAITIFDYLERTSGKSRRSGFRHKLKRYPYKHGAFRRVSKKVCK